MQSEARGRVLVVDDNVDAAVTLGFLLTQAGYEVETRFDGPSALAAAAEFEPDACVLDLNMPGMDGYQLARELRARAAERPPALAAVTAYKDLDHLEQAEEAGFDLYFSKPADPGDVAAQLRYYLG